MARSRNIKPSFFTNEDIAENDPLGRILFMGLWTIADFNGNLEYRPKRIKIQILPYDECDIEQLVTNLEKSRLIAIYNINQKTYIHINNFDKHQNPHPNERKKGTEIPEPTQVIDPIKVTINHDKSRQEREDSTSDPADSLFLIPDIPTYLGAEGIYKILENGGVSVKTFTTTDNRIRVNKWIELGITDIDLMKSISRAIENKPDRLCVAYLDPIVKQKIFERNNPGESYEANSGSNRQGNRTGADILAEGCADAFDDCA